MRDEYEIAKTVARIVGEASGAAKAVALYQQKQAEGKTPVLFMDRKNQDWVVTYD